MLQILCHVYLCWNDHKVTEEWQRDFSQFKNLYRSLNTNVSKQDIQHSAAMQIGDLQTQSNHLLIIHWCKYVNVNSAF